MNRKPTAYLLTLSIVAIASSLLGQSRRVESAAAKQAVQPHSRFAKRAPELAPADADGRRSTIVVLSQPSIMEYAIAKTSKILSDVSGKPGSETVDSERVRALVFSAEGEQYQATLQQAKAPLVAQMQARGMTVLSQAEHAMNAVMVRANDAELAWLKTLPGVKSVQFSRRIHVHLDKATQLVGANAAWTTVGGAGKAGAGVKIAMLDSGIDITNPMFSATGFTAPSGFPKFTTGVSGDQAYTNAKVIVAKNYICPATGSCSGELAVDHTAADDFGHGTGTASVAAGDCVTSPLGTTICGVAPGAYLGSYKVFDSSGGATDAQIMQAMNDALADKMNVINFSGGGDATGELPSQSLYAGLIHTIVTGGVAVVISAGNCGPVGEAGSCSYVGDNTIQDPGLVPDAITPGASADGQVLATKVLITGNGVTVPASLQTLAGAASSGQCNVVTFGLCRPSPAYSVGPAVIVDVATLDNNGFACNSLPAGSLTGKIALIRWSFDGCSASSIKVSNAVAAGAVGVIVIDNTPEEINAFSIAGGSVPGVLMTFQDGAALQFLVDSNPGKISASLGGGLTEAPQAGDWIADYSSRGPNNDFTIKPDLVAPGDLFAAVQKLDANTNGFYDATGFEWGAGTSYSAPMTSGAAAIIMGQRPTLSAYDVKSALVNTAQAVTATQDGATVSVMNQGGGRIYIPNALSTTLVSNPVSVSFGLVSAPAAGYTQTQSVVLKGVGTASETFNVTVNQTASATGLAITVPATVSVTTGGTTTLGIQLALSAAVTGIYEGTINLQSTTTATTIHIPYWSLLQAPVLPSNGLVDAAGFGSKIAPGGIVSLFGTGFGTGAYGASRIPLPGGLNEGYIATTGFNGGSGDLNHTMVTIYGNDTSQGLIEQQVPLFYSSPTQINFQIPFTLAVGTGSTVQMYLEGYPFTGIYGENSVPFTVFATAPGVFMTGASTGVMLHQNGSLVTAANPATRGETLTIYCTGLGAVSPAVNAGDPALFSPLSATTSVPAVAVGSAQGAVSFAGLTPGLAGLYQINVSFPSNTPTGAQQMTVSIGGNTSNTVTTYIQ